MLELLKYLSQNRLLYNLIRWWPEVKDEINYNYFTFQQQNNLINNLLNLKDSIQLIVQ